MGPYLCIHWGLHLCVEGVEIRMLEWPQSARSKDVLCRFTDTEARIAQ